MVDTVLSPIWYLISVLCFIASTLSVIPLGHTLFHFWCKKSNDINILTKLVVSLAFILFFMHIGQHLFWILSQLIPNGFHVTLHNCVNHIWLVSISYYMSKASMYSYFVLRTQYTFESTTFAYNKCIIWFLVLTIIIISLLLSVLWPILSVPMASLSIIQSTQGRKCIMLDYKLNIEKKNYASYMPSELAIATVLDLIFAMITVWMLVGKLF
eukprot:121848_1